MDCSVKNNFGRHSGPRQAKVHIAYLMTETKTKHELAQITEVSPHWAPLAHHSFTPLPWARCERCSTLSVCTGVCLVGGQILDSEDRASITWQHTAWRDQRRVGTWEAVQQSPKKRLKKHSSIHKVKYISVKIENKGNLKWLNDCTVPWYLCKFHQNHTPR